MATINVWTVLINPPRDLIGQQQQDSETFFEMIKNLLAPYYKLKSFTTIIMGIGIIIYITLACRYPPFLKIPTFALQPLILNPQHLRHFQFYRLFTSPFIYQDITGLALGTILMWSLGSYTEEMLGWKIFTVFTSMSGIIGFSNSFTLPLFLLGCNFSIWIMKWADPNSPMLFRKIMLIIYVIAVIIFILLFINYSFNEKSNIYFSTLYGFLMTSIVGKQHEGANVSKFRKLLASVTLTIFIFLSTILICNIVFSNKTFI